MRERVDDIALTDGPAEALRRDSLQLGFELDVIVAFGMAALFLSSAYQIVRQSLAEYRHGGHRHHHA